jgi:L-fucose mutarotase
MLNLSLIHPEILWALGRSGHGSRIVIADGNYPFATKVGPSAKLVFLNLRPGVLTVTEVLSSLIHVCSFEAGDVMVPDQGPEPAIFSEFRSLLPGVSLAEHSRFEFYDEAMDPHVTLLIATGDQRLFANLILTVAVADS